MQELLDFEEATKRITPEQYLEHLKGVRRLEIVLEAVDASVNQQIAAKSEQWDLKIGQEHRLESGDRPHAELLMSYVVRARASGKQALKIKATYRLRLFGETELPVEFFVIYGKMSGDTQTWPFFRELTYSLTSRMGITPLTLPLRILGAGTAPSPSESPGNVTTDTRDRE